MNAKRLLLVLSTTFALALMPVRAQLINNGGFETGTFSSWTLGGTAAVQSGSPGSAFVWEGTHGATLGSGILSQPFITTPGQTYHVEFLLNAILFTFPGPVEARWGNFDVPANLDLGEVTLFDESDIPALGWYRYSYNVLALGNVSSLTFEFQTQSFFYPNNVGLDAISVSSLPGFLALPVLAGVPIGDPSPQLAFGTPYVLSSLITAVAVPESSTLGVLGALGLVVLIACRSWFRTRRTGMA